jgi:ABC-type lipoprotein export system ATPase subunit
VPTTGSRETAAGSERGDGAGKIKIHLGATVHGPAGSGKTTLMREAVSAIETSTGKQVVVLAPSASAVDVLKKEGFAKSNTFQRFENNELLKSVARGQFVWVDEAARRTRRNSMSR